MYKSTKTYGHDLGLSACFRQWRAKSHCAKLHGYALAFRFEFGCDTVDENGWVMDFGALGELKGWLQDKFDHKVAVAKDDPLYEQFRELHELDLIDVVYLDGVGCEAFARMAFEYAEDMVRGNTKGRVRVLSVECREHGANSAIYESMIK